MRTIGFFPNRLLAGAATIAALLAPAWLAADEAVREPISTRYATDSVAESPDFQRHVSPLLGRLGCNSRSCHGSFQGRGGFQLSLFGYDFQLDHDAMLKGEKPRVDVKNPLESLVIKKPTDGDFHEGGLRYKTGSWEYHVFRRWIEAGAKFDQGDVQKLVRLEISPPEILFRKTGETVQLKAVAVWPDGSREDVTPICRFQSNSDQVATITENGLVTATDPGDTHLVVFYDNAVVPVPVIRPVSDLVGAKYPKTPTPTKVDELVVQKLKKLGVVQSDLSGDAEFLRRVSLDLTGTLPTAMEVEAFLGNPSPNKRSEKVEELLATPAYAAWWTTLLCDFTGNNEQQLNNVTSVRNVAGQEWYDWIYQRVAANMPYDQLAEGIVLGQSRKPGQTYTEYCEEMCGIYKPEATAKFADRPTMPYYWARTNFRLPEDRAIGFAYTFLGIRIQCAQCHKHPFDQWSKADFDAFKSFFTRVTFGQTGARDKETTDEYKKIVETAGIDTSLRGNDLRNKLPALLKEGKVIPFGEIYVVKPAPAPPARNRENAKTNPRNVPAAAKGRVLGGEELNLNEYEDARTPLMAWLRDKDNPYFARAFVNRVWANYFNVGIVQPPDDMSLANPPSNKPLLDYLAQGFIEHKFDMKWLHREIINSRTYQLSWKTNETNAKDERNFARSVPRRLPAEVAYDALMAATYSDEKAASMRTNLTGRGIFVATSSARQGGGAGPSPAFALQVFGRSIRESNCDCDRSMDASLLQTVYLQNDQQVLSQMSGGRDTWIDQLAQKVGRLADGGDPSKLDIQRELARTKFRLERAKKEKDEKQVANLEGRLQELQKAEKTAREVKANPGGLALDNVAVIRQAYLRTFSRPPTDDEVQRCSEFLAAAETPQDGVKGLLWALVNSKEFIVNH